MPAAPLPPDERARRAVVAELGLLDSAPDHQLNVLVRRAATALQVPTSVISILDTSRQWFKARVGSALTETSREVAFCGYTILDRSPLVVPDAQDDPRFADNILVTSAPGVRFYAGVPLVVGDAAIGAICAIDYKPRQIDSAQVEALVRIAVHAARRIAIQAAIRDGATVLG